MKSYMKYGDVFLTHRANFRGISRAPVYKYYCHTENAHERRRIIDWTGAGPLYRHFDEWRVAVNV